MSISDEKGVRLRATVTEFGPVLLSKILGLNDTQSSIMSIILNIVMIKLFRYWTWMI